MSCHEQKCNIFALDDHSECSFIVSYFQVHNKNYVVHRNKETNFVKHITNYDCAKFRNSLQTNFAFPPVITVCSRLLLHSLQIDRVNPKSKSSFCSPSCPGPVFDLLLMMDRCPSSSQLRWRIISGLLAITSALVLLHLDTATGHGETGFLYL